MRLDVALVHRRRVELALDHDFRRGQSFLEVAELELEVLGDVRRLARGFTQRFGDQVVVHKRRIVAHGFTHVDHDRQWLVIHLDEVERFLGNLRAGRGHRGHGMPLVKHLVPGERVVAQMLDHDGALTQLGHAGAGFGHVLPRDDRFHPG